MKQGEARIISESGAGSRVCAASARISTTEGGALECFEMSDGGAKDNKLISKVLASGHQTIVEHTMFSVAFNDVSVMAEQFVIEFRLASYTVKSRRYVNFSGAGFVMPDGLDAGLADKYAAHMRARFETYDKLLSLGIPREDARFVLPYCFRSNFYVTLNARELTHMICQMVYGRGKRYPELYALGLSLRAQLEARLPGVADMESARARECAQTTPPRAINAASPARAEARLIGAPADARALLNAALDFSGRYSDYTKERAIKALTRDARPRELELLQYAFGVDNLSLACLTHFTRHRMLSLLTTEPARALAGSGYVTPLSVGSNTEARRIYARAFEQNADDANQMLISGLDNAHLCYYALAGNVTNIIVSMNARELMHFFRLRACARAQWEIRAVASDMLALLMEDFPELFKHYGPSCAVLGYCPEGRLSCKRARTEG